MGLCFWWQRQLRSFASAELFCNSVPKIFLTREKDVTGNFLVRAHYFLLGHCYFMTYPTLTTQYFQIQHRGPPISELHHFRQKPGHCNQNKDDPRETSNNLLHVQRFNPAMERNNYVFNEHTHICNKHCKVSKQS